jgi:hypothetical protein
MDPAQGECRGARNPAKWAFMWKEPIPIEIAMLVTYLGSINDNIILLWCWNLTSWRCCGSGYFNNMTKPMATIKGGRHSRSELMIGKKGP